MTKSARRRHMARVAELPCCVTGMTGVQVHHLIGRNMRGMSQKASDWFTIPLHHEIHAELHRRGWREWEQAYGSQLDHLERTLEALYG